MVKKYIYMEAIRDKIFDPIVFDNYTVAKEFMVQKLASKLNHDYMMNGERWNGTKRIKTKAQIKTEHTKHEAEMKKKGAEYDKERAKYEAKLKKAKAAEQKSKKSKIAKDK